MNNLRTVISRILDITGYGDKTEFTEGLIDLCRQQATFNLINSLSTGKREAFEKELANSKNAKETQKIVSKMFAEGEYKQVFKIASEEIIKSYIEAIWPVLSATQKKEVISKEV